MIQVASWPAAKTDHVIRELGPWATCHSHIWGDSPELDVAMSPTGDDSVDSISAKKPQ